MASLLHLRGEGTPREFGRLHGERARDLIQDNLKLYFHRFQEEWRIPREEVLRRARSYLDVIGEADNAYLEALQGVAEGARAPLLEVTALNVRYEIVYSEYSKLGQELGVPSGCTAVGLLPATTRDGHLLLAQNWDWIPGVQGLMQEYAPPGAPRFLAFTEAGIVGGKIGLNERGLGMLINGLISDQDNWERLGVPFHVRCWKALQASSLHGAAALLRDTPSSCSANFVLGQAQGVGGEIVDLETSPVGTAELRPENGVLVHANHFHQGESLGIWQPFIEGRTSTFEREARMSTLLSERRDGDKMELENLQSFLRDHEGRPTSLCRHPELELPEERRYVTVVSVLMDLHARRMLVSDGNPCETEYEEFSLGGS